MPTLKPLVLALIACGLAAGPARADDLVELKAQMRQLMESNARMARQIAELEDKLKASPPQPAVTAQQARAVTAGDEEGTWKLPGSDTSIGLYGFVHLDAYVDARGRQAADWAADIGSQPVPGGPGNDARRGKFNLTARTSRLGLKTLTPTELGALRTVLEADFNKNPSGGDGVLNNTLVASNFGFRLRHAYGELDGSWGKLLAGQTWSTFMNLDSAPETVDFNGHGSAAFVRQSMIRYVAKLGTAGDFALAVENPHGALDGGTAQATPNIDKRPDLVANWSLARSWGSLSVQALSTEYRYDNGAVTARAGGHGFGIGGAFKPTEKDTLTLQITTGKGLGRYLPTTSWHIASYSAAANAIHLYRSHSYVLGWNRNWTDRVRSNLAFGSTRIGNNRDSDFSDGFIDSRRMTEGFANVIMRIARNTEWGLEYSWGRRETYPWLSGAGATGLAYTGLRRRYQTSLRYTF